jgi:hypothetical protein
MPWAGFEPTIRATNRPRPTPQTARPLWPAKLREYESKKQCTTHSLFSNSLSTLNCHLWIICITLLSVIEPVSIQRGNYILENKTAIVFVFCRGTKVHHSFTVPRKNEQSESEMLKWNNLWNINPNTLIGKSRYQCKIGQIVYIRGSWWDAAL